MNIDITKLGWVLAFDEDFTDPATVGTSWTIGQGWTETLPPVNSVIVNNSIATLTWAAGQAVPTDLTTASLDMKKIRSFRHGLFGARIRYQPVPGAWPAFWARSATTDKDVVEVDGMEGQSDLPPNTIATSAHVWDGSRENWSNAGFNISPAPNDGQWHEYCFLWEPGRMTWFVDGVAVNACDLPPEFESLPGGPQSLYLLLTMQGGQKFDYGNLPAGAPTMFEMEVDWVRVWQKSF